MNTNGIIITDADEVKLSAAGFKLCRTGRAERSDGWAIRVTTGGFLALRPDGSQLGGRAPAFLGTVYPTVDYAIQMVEHEAEHARVQAAQPAPIEVPGVDPIPMEKIGAAEMAKVGALALKLKAIFTTEEILVLSEALTQYTDNAEEVAEDDATVAANRETAIGILDAVDALIAEPV